MSYLETLATIYVFLMAICTVFHFLNFSRFKDVSVIRKEFEENERVVRENNMKLRNELHIWKKMHNDLYNKTLIPPKQNEEIK